jgi:hypothetical protein
MNGGAEGSAARNSPSGPPPGPVANLDIGAAIQGVFAVILRNPGAVLRTLFIPAVLSSFLALPQSGLPLDDPAHLMLLPLTMIPLVMAAVSWHRFQLLGEQPGFLPSRLQPLLVYYGCFWLVWGLSLGAAIAIALPLSLIIAGLGGEGLAEGALIPVLVAIFAFLAWLYIRLCFVFPAVAVGERYRLGDSWRQTKGQALRIFIAALMTSAPFVLVILMLVVILADFAGLDPESAKGLPLSLLLLFSFAQLLMLLPLISTLSIAFRQVSGWLPQPARTGSQG